MANKNSKPTKPTTRSKSKGKEPPPPPPKPWIRLDRDRIEEIAAIGVLILTVLTILGALNLSTGIIIDSWVHLLRSLLGWGIYLAPFIFGGLGIWLFLDALDKTWNIGWERPIGVILSFLVLLIIFDWLTPANTTAEMTRSGGFIGAVLTVLLTGAVGDIGSVVALIALIGISLILLFNISLPELVRRIVYTAKIIRHLPDEIKKFRFGKQPLESQSPPMTLVDQAKPSIEPRASRSGFPEPQSARGFVQPRETHGPRLVPPQKTATAETKTEPALSHGPVAARIIGGTSTSANPPTPEGAPTLPPAPVIQREWRLPQVNEILEDAAEGEINNQEIRTRVRQIEETLSHFGVPAQVVEVNQGPTITQFGVEPGFIEQKSVDGKMNRVKIKVSRITGLQHDLELALAAAPIRIEAPVPGRSFVGIEVPNTQTSRVTLRSVMESEDFKKIKSKLRVPFGQDVSGQPVSDDLVKMPHLLIAGATGSGKSVCINAIVAGLLCTTTPDEVKFVMVDPKRVELVNFNGIPHLVQPVVVDVNEAVAALQNTVQEMDRRFKRFAEKGARNIEIYNNLIKDKPGEERFPFWVVIVDELADLMMLSAQEVEHAITRLAQMARATGIHLILATQRPSVDVVTGLIKANFPSRVSFAVTSQIDSRVVLDTPGAEKLLGRGDMLYMASDSSKLARLQGCFVSDLELERLVNYWKEMAPPPITPPAGSPIPGTFVQAPLFNENQGKPKSADGEDNLLPQAIQIIQQNNKASVSLLQRKLRIGYTRAARLIELLEEKGMVGPDEGPTKGRSVLVTEERATEMDYEGEDGVASQAPPRPTKPNRPSNVKTTRRTFDQGDGFDNWTEKDWADLDKE